MKKKIYNYTPKDSNKIKKCNCEEKYGPKPFNNQNYNDNYQNKTN